MRSLLDLLPSCRRGLWFGLLAMIALAAACKSAPAGKTRRMDRSVITREQLVDGSYATVYDAVAALRSNWLRARGPDSFVMPSIVWVYVDGARAGDVEVLRNIQPKLVNTVRFYDGPTATGRWGVNNGSGVIHVSTWSDGAGGIPLPDSTRGTTKPARDSSSKR
jgi:hypothetical protein